MSQRPSSPTTTTLLARVEPWLLLFCIPFLLLPNLWLPATAVTLLLLTLLLLLPLLTRHRPILPATPFNLLILLWLVGIGVSALVTADPDKTLPQFTRFIASLLLFYLLITAVRRRRHLNQLAHSLIALGALLALIAPVAVVWHQTKGGLIPEPVYALFPLLSPQTIHPNIMASLMILLLPLPLAYFWRDWASANRRWSLWLLISAWMGFVLLLTKSRGGYLAAVLGVLFVLWLLRRRWLAGGVLALTAVAALWLFTTANTAAISSDLTDPGTLAFRLEVWRIALWMMGDFPFTGVGMGAFNDVALRLYPIAASNDPGTHNVYLQVGVDLGIPGLIMYLAWLLLAFYLAAQVLSRAEKQADEALRTMVVGAWAGLLGYAAHGLIDNGLWLSQVSFVPWLVVAFITAAYLISAPPPAPNRPTPSPGQPTPDPNAP